MASLTEITISRKLGIEKVENMKKIKKTWGKRAEKVTKINEKLCKTVGKPSKVAKQVKRLKPRLD